MISIASSGAWIGEPTVHFLMLVRDLVTLANLSMSEAGVRLWRVSQEEVVFAGKDVVDPLPAGMHQQRRSHATRAGMPPKANAFSMWSASRRQAAMPEDCCAA